MTEHSYYKETEDLGLNIKMNKTSHLDAALALAAAAGFDAPYFGKPAMKPFEYMTREQWEAEKAAQEDKRKARRERKAAKKKKKYWHEVPKEERDRILSSKMMLSEFMRKYRQPYWCMYPDALAGIMGCWSLFPRPDRISKTGCESCHESTLHKCDKTCYGHPEHNAPENTCTQSDSTV